ncbi:RNB domain-containing ribonuclease [Limibacter armeniacum]|uniref:ribonuclease R family protein n=1 Tax=Limibacter armeniacum TaxID=466084 RepID=UPI002FE555CD
MSKKKKDNKNTANKKKRHSKSEGTEGAALMVKNIMTLLNSAPEKPFSHRQITKQLQLKKKGQKDLLEKLLDKLVEEQQLLKIGYRYQSTNSQGLIRGTVDHVNPRFGYIVTGEDEADIWVSTPNLNRALDGDTVEIRTYFNGRKRRTEGEVVRIVERARDEFIGHLELSARFAFVVTMGRKMHQDIFIPKNGLGDAKHGDKVIAKIDRWKEDDKNPIGKVIKVLGRAGENETEIHSIMFEYGLPFKFPDEVEMEAEAIPEEIPAEEIKKRRDFRTRTTFTIDPLTAKDFDDALSIRKMKNGQWEIGVHIADVTHYVRPDTILEEEAEKRATSVYLVDRTVPMLPEKLSNGLCSLNPNVDRLAFSAVFNMDEEGKIYKQWFGRTVIHSDRRFTYEEAQERIESGEGDYAEEIITLNEIAKKMKDDRFRNGAISFESVEFRFELDEDGKPLGLFPRIRKDAHKMIEEFMLLANKRVAEYVYRKKKRIRMQRWFTGFTTLQTLKK